MSFKKCFGDLSKVFPAGEDGLRTSPEDCLACDQKTACLRYAMAGSQGAEVHEERVDRNYDAGQMGFLERWSRKKALHRAKNKK